MDHGGEAARSNELGMAGAVQGSQANIGTGTYAYDGQLVAAAARRFSFDGFEPSAAAYHHNSAGLHVRAAAGRGEVPVSVFHREPGPGGVYANIGEFWRQPGPVRVALAGPQLPGGVVPVHHSYFNSALQPGPGAGRGVVLAALLPGAVGAVYNGDYAMQPRPGAGHGEVLVDLHPDGAGHGEAFVGELLDGGVAAYDDYGYYELQPRPGAGHGELLVDLLPDDAGRSEAFIGPLPDGVAAVFDNSSNFVQQIARGTERAGGIAGALREPNLGSGGLADDLGAVYDNAGMAAEHLCRLLPFAGIGACSVAVNGLAAGPGSPAVAVHLFVLLLGGLFLVILHVLRVYRR